MERRYAKVKVFKPHELCVNKINYRREKIKTEGVKVVEEESCKCYEVIDQRVTMTEIAPNSEHLGGVSCCK